MDSSGCLQLLFGIAASVVVTAVAVVVGLLA